MTLSKFEATFPGELLKVREVVRDALCFIEQALPCLTESERFDLKLIYSELLNNAVIHGNKRDKSKSVHLMIEVHGGNINSVICDEGVGFDYLRLLSKEEDPDRYTSESGRGIKLVYSLTDSLTFNQQGNEIKFYKRVKHNG